MRPPLGPYVIVGVQPAADFEGTKSSRVLSGRECPICEISPTQISRFGNHGLLRPK
jgi:hypothetical protein